MTIERYDLRAELFEHRGTRLRLAMPRAADELIDEADFERDERIPYWAELWPSARALARELIDRGISGGRVIEIGCGLGLPSLVASAGGARVTATDYYDDALEFVGYNARINAIEPPATRRVDWRTPPVDLGRFDLVFAADVLYEARNVPPLLALLHEISAPGTHLILADPGRRYRETFDRLLAERGWVAVSSVERPEPSGDDEGCTVRISEWARADADPVRTG